MNNSLLNFKVLIPLFRSFILIEIATNIIGQRSMEVLIPLFRSFILIGQQTKRCAVLYHGS